MRPIGPVDDTTLPTHTTNWRLENVNTTGYNGQGNGDTFQYGPQWVFWENNGLSYTAPNFPPTSSNVPTFPNPARYYMKPMRFALSGWEAWKALTGERHYRQRPVSALQRSDLSAPATSDGHFSGSVIDRVTLPRRWFSSCGSAAGSRIVAAKVWIDGTNVGGLISFTGGGWFTAVVGGGIPTFGAAVSVPFNIPIPSTTVSSASEIFVDVWVEMRIGFGNEFGSLLVSATGVNLGGYIYYFAPIIAAHGSNGPVSSPFAAFAPGIDAQRRIRSTDVWNLTLTGGTVGGVSSLAMTPQANWQYTNQGGLIRMLKIAGTAVSEEVQLNYATEAPEIRIRKNPTRPDGADGGWCKYMIQSPSYFGAIGQSNWQFGPITATGANTFTRIARGFYDGANSLSPPWVDVAALPAPTIQLTGFPTSISATR
jgi:hypothetical protein